MRRPCSIFEELGGSGGDAAEVVVWRGASRAEAVDLALVLSAVEIPHELGQGPDHEWQLLVPGQAAPEATRELAAYCSERLHRRRPPPLTELPNAGAGVAAYLAVLVIVALCAWNRVFGFNWLSAGEVDAGDVVNGELWRTVTALMLHANLAHLAGNLGFGGFFGYFVGRYFGVGLGWFSILAGGALGNLLNAWVQPPQHQSIGASTAVFAALGLLTAHAWLRNLGQTSWWARAAPIAAGIGLLAFTGTAGEHTDIIAHLMGFASGFGLGAVLTRLPRPRAMSLQAAFAALTLALIVSAWGWGLAAAG